MRIFSALILSATLSVASIGIAMPAHAAENPDIPLEELTLDNTGTTHGSDAESLPDLLDVDGADIPNIPTPSCRIGQTQAMYRLYNRISHEHLYTADTNERDTLARGDWSYEGISWVSPVQSSTPVFRLYNPILGDHHYTTDTHERDILRSKHRWIYEGIAWYSDDCHTAKVYRQFNRALRTGSHHYTGDVNEYNTNNSRNGWKGEGVAWYAVSFQKDYYYTFLSGKEKAAYAALRAGIYAHKTQISLGQNLSGDEIGNVWRVVRYDDPGIFWSYAYKYISGSNAQIFPIYRYTYAQRRTLQKTIDTTTQTIMSQIPTRSTYHRGLYLAQSLVDRITYEKSSQPFGDQFIDATLAGTKGVCNSYATAFKYLADRAGIFTIYVSGNVTNEGLHAWNLITIDGEVSYVDVTWMDGEGKTPTNYSWFASPEDIAMAQRSLEYPHTKHPSANSYVYNYASLQGTFFSSYDSHVANVLSTHVQQGDKNIYLQFANKSEYDKAYNDYQTLWRMADDYTLHLSSSTYTLYFVKKSNVI